jgi:hypothetical protein
MRSRRVTAAGCVAAGLAIAGLGLTGCGTGTQAAPSSAASAATGSQATDASAARTTQPRPATAQGVAATTPVLRSIRTVHHASYDRVVFQFDGALPTYRLRYVPQVIQDPSGEPIRLDGAAYVAVAFQGSTARRYAGPRTVSPAYPLLKQVKVTGDFESVLSFGIGLADRAPVHVRRLTAPSRIVVDFAAVRPLWPVRAVAEAAALQASADKGHQPWLLAPEQVVAAYAKAKLSWDNPQVHPVTATVYEVRQPGSTGWALVQVAQPVRQGSDGIWVVTSATPRHPVQ